MDMYGVFVHFSTLQSLPLLLMVLNWALVLLGIVLTRVGYYTIPSMEELAKMTNDRGECLVMDFTIGRKGENASGPRQDLFCCSCFAESSLLLDCEMQSQAQACFLCPVSRSRLLGSSAWHSSRS